MTESRSSHVTPEKHGPRVGELVVFWGWMSVISIGLAVMIFVPLTGR